MISTMRKTVEKIFNEQNLFDSIEEFYMRLHHEYRYVVIVPRKCLTEYKIFRKLWEKEALDYEGTTFMTTKGLVRYKERIKKELKDKDKEKSRKYLAIVDDIMIYGRGINNFLIEFYDSLGEDKETLIEETYLEVFIESCNRMLFRKDFQSIWEKRYDVFFSYANRSLLNRASDIFIDSFRATCTPNTSFVRSWFFKNEGNGIPDIVYRLKRDKKLMNYWPGKYNTDNTHKTRTSFEWVNYIFSERNVPFASDNITEFCCLRYYYSKTVDRHAFTPYVFLKPMTYRQIDNTFDKISNYLRFSSMDERNALWTKQNDSQYYILKFEYLTQFYSDLYGIYLLKKYMRLNDLWDSIFYDDSDILAFSYGADNVYSIPELEKQYEGMGIDAFRELFADMIADNQIVDDADTDSASEKDATQIFERVMTEIADPQGRKDIYNLVRRYFAYNGEEDNRRAERAIKAENEGAIGSSYKTERIYGISTGTLSSRILKSLNQNLKGKLLYIYGTFLDCMDNGICALTMKKKGPYIASFLNAGEQAYRVLSDPYMQFFKYFAKIEETCKNRMNAEAAEQRIEEFLEEALKLENEEEVKEKRAGIEYLRGMVNEQKKSYWDIYVPRDDSNQKNEKYDQIYYQIMQ